jgi:hypothetical protein
MCSLPFSLIAGDLVSGSGGPVSGSGDLKNVEVAGTLRLLNYDWQEDLKYPGTAAYEEYKEKICKEVSYVVPHIICM